MKTSADPSPQPSVLLPVENRSSTGLTALASFDVADGDSGYLGDLVRLTLATGEGSLAPGANGNFVLPATVPPPGGGAARVIVADAGSLCPLATYVVALTPGTAETRTVTSDDARAASLSVDLWRNLMAAPTSKLALDFVAAADVNSAAADPDAVLADFFASHPPFTGLGFDLLPLMLGWMRAYALIWGVNNTGGRGRRYDLFASPFYGVRGDSVGTIEFRPPPVPAAADPADHNSGYTIAFLPESGDPAGLHLAGLVLGDGTGGRLALMGAFADPVWLAGSAKDQTLWPVLAGRLDGQPVIAVPADPANVPAAHGAPPTSRPTVAAEAETPSSMDITMTVINFIGLVSSIVTIVGGILAFVGWYRSRKARGVPIEERQGLIQSNEEIERLKELLESISEKVGNQESLLTREEFQNVAKHLRENVVETLTKVAREQTKVSIQGMTQEIKKLASVEITEPIQESIRKLGQAQENLGIDLKKSNQMLTEVVSQVPESIKSLGNQINDQLKETIENATAEIGVSVEISFEIEGDVKLEVRDGDWDVIEGPELINN